MAEIGLENTLNVQKDLQTKQLFIVQLACKKYMYPLTKIVKKPVLLQF